MCGCGGDVFGMHSHGGVIGRGPVGMICVLIWLLLCLVCVVAMAVRFMVCVAALVVHSGHVLPKRRFHHIPKAIPLPNY